MQTVKFVYSGSATRKLTVMGRDQVIVSGDNKSTQFIFSFPKAYDKYFKMIIWGDIKRQNITYDSISKGVYEEDGEEYPIYPLVNNCFKIPSWITVNYAGKEVQFQIVVYKSTEDDIDLDTDEIEVSTQFPVYISKTVIKASQQENIDLIVQLAQSAYCYSSFYIDDTTDRPAIVFKNINQTEIFTLILDIPYLVDGHIPKKFIEGQVSVYNVNYYSNIQSLEPAPQDLAVIQIGNGVKGDYAGDIYLYDNGQWIPIYSQFDSAELQNKVDKTTMVNGHPLTSDINLTKQDVGLGNVDNTSDLDKPISNATQQQLDLKADKSDLDLLEGRVSQAEDDIVSLDGRLDVAESDIDANAQDISELQTVVGDQSSGLVKDVQTLKTEVETTTIGLLDRTTQLEEDMSQAQSDISALQDQVDDVYTKAEVDAELATKVDKTTTVNGHELSADITLTKQDVGLGNVDNTSDIDKPVSTATQAQLDLKADQTEVDQLESRMDTAEQDIDQLETDVSDRYTKAETDNLLDTKVDKESGKGLSTNDFTDALKNKLDDIQSGAEINVQSDWTESDSNSDQYILHKPTLGTASALDYVTTSQGSLDSGKVVALNGSGKIDNSMVPNLTIGQYVGEVSLQQDLITLSDAEQGDIAKVTGEEEGNGKNGVYWLNGVYSTLSNWVQIVGEGNVISVNGQSGIVVLDKSDIGLGNVDNTSDLDKPISTATQTELSKKINVISSPVGDMVVISTQTGQVIESSAITTKIAGIENGAQVNIIEQVALNGVNLPVNSKVVSVTADTTATQNSSNLITSGAVYNEIYAIQTSAVMQSGITQAKVSEYDTHISDNTIHVTQSDKTYWNNKQDQIVLTPNIVPIQNSEGQITSSTITSAELTQLSGITDNIQTQLDNKTGVLKAIGEWDPTLSYLVNSTVIYDGAIYISKQDNNINKTPDSETSYWSIIEGGGGGGGGGDVDVVQATIGDGATKSFTIRHDLGTRDVFVTVREAVTGYEYIGAQVQATTINTVTVTFTDAPALNSVRVIISAGTGQAYEGYYSYEYTQDVPSTIWTINHPFDRNCLVQTFNTSGQIVEGIVTQTHVGDTYTVTVGFNEAIQGTAILI